METDDGGFTRGVVGVAAGYVAIPIVTMLGTVVATRFVDASAVLVRPGDVEPTGAWLAFGVGLGGLAALAGGMLCAAISRSRRVPVLLAAIVLSMGFALAIPLLRGASGPATERDVPLPRTAFQAALVAESPLRWLVWKPVVSALLVLAGARLVARRD